jgi:hypothetical protein
VSNHLVSNDNHRSVEHRGLEEARVVNAALLGAIAGAGLTSAHQVAAEIFHASAMHDTSFGRSVPLQTLSDSHLTVREAATSDLALQPTHVVSGEQQLASVSLSHAGDAGMGHGLAGHESVVQHAMSQLLAATSGPAMGHGPAPMAAAAIAIPPAQMLAAHMGVDKGGAEAQNVTAVQSNAVVGKVLADSLAGGHAHGPNIDTLLSHVAAGHGHGGAPDALAALASHDAGGVSFGHSGGFAGFHAAPLMEQMMIHQDAAATQNS